MRKRSSGAAIPDYVLQRQDMREAVARHDFGKVFHLARRWAGISYSRIAEACDMKPERVGTLARGQGTVATYDKIAAIADALRIPGHMLGLSARPWERSTLHPTDVASRMDGDSSVQRRDFLRATMMVAESAVGLEGIPRDVTQHRVGAHLVGVLRHRTEHLRRLDNTLGGGDTLAIYEREYAATKQILRQASYTDATRHQLLALLAEQAQQAGWAAFDAGYRERAREFYTASYTIAAEVAEQPLAANALAYLAYQAIADDPAQAVTLATRSCIIVGDGAPSSVLALLHERRAWSHAVAGESKETERALDSARAALQAEDGQPQPPWSSWVDTSELDIMARRCWTELRRPLRAAPILGKALESFDDGQARDKALYSCWLADAYLMAGEIEATATTVDQILDLSAGVASVRPRERLRPIIRSLEDNIEIPSVADVLAKVRA